MADKVVLVDMDGVLANFDAEVLRHLRLRLPDLPMVPRKNFFIAEDYPQYSDLVWGIMYERGFFRRLELIANALQGWQRLLDLGYHPRVCSAPMIPNPSSIQEKLDWIDEKMGSHFGSGVADEAVIDTRRYELEAAALIDDRPQVENSHLASWQHVIFDAPYNRSSAGPRLRGWLDPDLPQLLGA